MLYILNDLIKDPELSDLDVVVWCFMSADVYSVNTTYRLVSPASVIAQMYGNLDSTKYLKKQVSKSIKHLKNTGYITTLEDSDLVTIDGFNFKEDYFCKADICDLRNILQSEMAPFSILRLYLLILSTINTRDKCSMWGLERFAELLQKDTKTVSKYIKILENMKLIYVYRVDKTTNTYGRYEDCQLIADAAKKRTGGKKDVSISANTKRRYTQMYNQVKNHGKQYSPKQMTELREYCARENAKRQQINSNYTVTLYDLSVLD